MTQTVGRTSRSPHASQRANEALDEIRKVIASLDHQQVENFTTLILQAPRVFWGGSGRSLLIAKCVAMRLMHIGVDVHVVGAVTTPAIRPGDLLIVASARGGATALRMAEQAKKIGARIAMITQTRRNIGDYSVDLILEIKARSTVETEQHAGSLFEQSLLVLGDAVCRCVQERQAIPSAALDMRHANL